MDFLNSKAKQTQTQPKALLQTSCLFDASKHLCHANNAMTDLIRAFAISPVPRRGQLKQAFLQISALCCAYQPNRSHFVGMHLDATLVQPATSPP